MKINIERLVAGAVALVSLGAILCMNLSAQTPQSSGKPQFSNAKVEERQVKAGLAQEVDAWAAGATQAQWLGYSVPAVSSDRRMCCGDSGGDWNSGKCGPCRLEGNKGENSYNVQNGNIKLEGPTMLVQFVSVSFSSLIGSEPVSVTVIW